MTRRTKIAVSLLALASVLTLAGVTTAWFVAVSATPPGLVRSALVRYLPEHGGQDLASLITYGNLVSGGSIDAEGVPLILPGDRLIPSVATSESAVRTIRTSQTRRYQSGETAGSVICAETRYYNQGVNLVTVTQTQRNLLDLLDTYGWQMGGSTEFLPEPPDPLPNSATHSIETTSTTTAVPGSSQSVTTTIVTTIYTPLPSKPSNIYRHVRTVVSTVTHEAATLSAADGVDAATLWNGDTALPNRNTKTDETVLYTDGAAITRTYLLINDLNAGSPAAERAPLPLKLGNLSTIDSCVRVGLSSILVDKDGIQALQPKVLNGVWYYGLNDEAGKFIPLLAYKPAAVTTGSASYGWVKSDSDSDNTWTLWDLTFSPDTAASHKDVPPLPTPLPDPSPSPAVEPDPSAEPEPEADPTPVLYNVADDFYVVSTVPAGVDMTNAYFEQMFNELYCSASPTIQIRLHYYVRQSEYMDWSQFYKDEITLTVTPDLSEGGA